MNILVTGGAGYIGSHTCVALLETGHAVTVLDNLCNSSEVALQRVQELAGKPLRFVQGDLRNPHDLAQAFARDIDAVIHFAALKAVGESCEQPLRYFDNNIAGTIALMQAMQDLIRDWCSAQPEVSAVLLRYFNPVGAHPSGRIGEDPRGTPNNLMPYIAQVAIGRRERLQVFGNDYLTPDGTGVRDYLHVVDLADAHVKALDFAIQTTGCHVFNLGTGRGHSVLELIHAFEHASGKSVPYTTVERRQGDVAELWADATHANNVLGWHPTHSLADMCTDTWRWQTENPTGFAE